MSEEGKQSHSNLTDLNNHNTHKMLSSLQGTL